MGDGYQELQKAIDALEYMRGEAAMDQIQKIIAVAEKHNDTDAAAEWTEQLLRIASHLGRLDIELQAFSKLRQLYDSDAKFAYLRDNLLWFYKWIADKVFEHVDVSRAMVENVLHQMQEFYQAEKESLRPVYSIRRDAAIFMGQLAEAEKYHVLFGQTEPGQSDDCPACTTHGEVCYLLGQDKPDEAIKAAAPIFSGEQYCEEVPATTFSRLLMAVLFQGEGETAEAMHRAVVRQIRLVPKLVGYLASHVMYLSLTGRAKLARRIACVLLGRGTQSPNSYVRLSAWRGGWVWAVQLQSAGVQTVRLPALFDPAAPQGMQVEELAARCRRETLKLTLAYDHRHGNHRFEDSFKKMEEVLKIIRTGEPPTQ